MNCGISGAVISVVCIAAIICIKPLKRLLCGEENLSQRQILYPILYHEPTAILAVSGSHEEIPVAVAKYVQNTIHDEQVPTNEQVQIHQV